jgi:hypothetical protein
LRSGERKGKLAKKKETRFKGTERTERKREERGRKGSEKQGRRKGSEI